MECGVDVDHMRLYCWVQHYAPEMEKRPRWYGKRPSIDRSWRVEETYVKVKGQWTHLYRAVDKGWEQPLKTAYATIKGFKVMRALHKGQAALWQYGGGAMRNVRLIERQFGVYTA